MSRLSGRVLITGGAGFLGRAIMRRAQREGWPTEFVVYSRDEQKHEAIRSKYPATYVIGDVTDSSRLLRYMEGCETVIHTAALKYIPEAEKNPWECVRVNVDGSRTVIMAAIAAEVPTTIMISTDKAAHPVNTYGMTKALMERMVHETGTWQGAKIVACRYGNVIGSTGSIWPVMKAQYKQLGYLQITDPEMTRFFMSVDDAIDLILASLEAPHGSVMIPRPKAAKLVDIVRGIALQLGLKTSSINTVGRRLGEKLHEDMLGPNEVERTEECGDYFVLYPPGKNGITNAHAQYMRSDTPYFTMSVQEFLTAARNSESV